jgi:hypothetical protein
MTGGKPWKVHPPVVSSEALSHNMLQMQYLRAWAAISSGLVAGLLGLESFSGFAFYALVSLLLSGSTYTFATNGLFSSASFWVSPSQWLSQDVLANAPSYVLFWTLSYGLLHVY